MPSSPSVPTHSFASQGVCAFSRQRLLWRSNYMLWSKKLLDSKQIFLFLSDSDCLNISITGWTNYRNGSSVPAPPVGLYCWCAQRWASSGSNLTQVKTVGIQNSKAAEVHLLAFISNTCSLFWKYGRMWSPLYSFGHHGTRYLQMPRHNSGAKIQVSRIFLWWFLMGKLSVCDMYHS